MTITDIPVPKSDVAPLPSRHKALEEWIARADELLQELDKAHATGN